MKEKIKMILCLCLIIAGLPILMTLVFQGDEILLDTDSNEIQHKSSHPDEEEKMAALVSILARDIPVTYEEEAIRAQAVIVRTNYEYALSQGKAPETGLSVAEQTKLFGNENYNRYYLKLENCLIDTEGEVLTYQGQEIEFVISEFNPRRNRVIGDRRQLLVAERAEKQKELFAKINVGDRMEGTVKNVTDFGAFIDLGGVDGLLHISEMSWGRVENPKKVFQVGD